MSVKWSSRSLLGQQIIPRIPLLVDLRSSILQQHFLTPFILPSIEHRLDEVEGGARRIQVVGNWPVVIRATVGDIGRKLDFYWTAEMRQCCYWKGA